MENEVCIHCKRPFKGHYTITKFDANNVEAGKVKVCSLICLLNWAHKYTMARGVRGIMTFKNAIDQIASSIRGTR